MLVYFIIFAGNEEKKRRSSIRRPSIRSVSGPRKTFTVINYDATEDEVDFPPRSSSLTSDATGVRFHLLPSNDSQPSAPLLEEKPGTPVFNNNHIHQSLLQRTLSIEEDQDFRLAIKQVEQGLDVTDAESVEVYKSWTKKKFIRDVARRGRLFAKCKTERLICKNGDVNLSNTNIRKKRLRYFEDLFTTVLELKWGWTLVYFVSSFLIGWILFALIWWLISVNQLEVRCVDGVHNFASALLFSIETQQTIGYGTRAVTAECPGAVFLMMFQSLFGVVIQCIMTGIIFAKLGHARKRGQTIMFSKNAVIHKHDHNLCFMFRMGDMRKSHMICVTLNAILVKQKLKSKKKGKPVLSNDSSEDAHPEFKRCKLELNAESDDLYFMAWPITIVHKINENSPLWDITPETLLTEDFEIIVVLEGINEITGMTTQLRTSYLPREIMWGHKLAPLLNYQKCNGKYNIDYTQFNQVRPVDTQELSAKEMKELKSRRMSTRSTHSHIHKHFLPQVDTVNEMEEEVNQND